MNIQNRLEKLEARTLGNNSEFCGCRSYSRNDWYLQPEGEEPMTLDGKPLPRQPEICGNCRKQLDKQIVIFQGCVGSGGPPLSHAPNVDPDSATFTAASEYSN